MLSLARRLAQLDLPGQAAQAQACVLPLLLTSLQQFLQPHGVRQYAARRAPGIAVSQASGDDDTFDEPEPVLRLPDLATIRQLNPRLHEIMLQHEEQQKVASTADTIVAALEAANPGAKRPLRVNKTALRALRVDQLRSLLHQLAADSRGSKDVLVQRLLDISSSEQQQQQQEEQPREAAISRAAAGVKEGVISRRQVAAQQAVAQRLTEAAQRGGFGVPEATLREGHREMLQKADFSQIFKPEEVAEIFADARADDIVIIDVRGRCPFTDWMVLCTARSQRLAHMMASAVLHQVKARAREVAPGVTPNIEGSLTDSEWLVVDAGSVVAHVFVEGHREEYGLEELWGRRDGSNISRVAPRKTVHTLDSLR